MATATVRITHGRQQDTPRRGPRKKSVARRIVAKPQPTTTPHSAAATHEPTKPGRFARPRDPDGCVVCGSNDARLHATTILNPHVAGWIRRTGPVLCAGCAHRLRRRTR